ncbi:putative esterase (plasmid) [Mycobacterium sp. JS623]|uniref:alpha/beta hydrolase n=1 Tax=Mycobacterium sp. JS623 TaxID=212767 RepID=UPI0002A58E36|nr:alpha/beta hydrolase-fold protein [Mycobacterium sp. JS623]AGB26854.1 putative esterase [Mycobacterium sp. JS623]
MNGSLTHLSLMHGWLPVTLQLAAGLALIAATGWRTRRWRAIWVPSMAAFGAAVAATAYLYVQSAGIIGDAAPAMLWAWIALAALSTAVLLAGWRTSRWWRRAVSVAAVVLSTLSVVVTVNSWVGYVPTVAAAWTELTAGPLPDQTDPATLSAMRQRPVLPRKGSIVSVTIDPSASGFRHRTELVYLPPAWFASQPSPPLPAVMMIGGEFNTPSDWLRAGNAVATLDAYAVAHSGYSPVVVFVDSGGGFNIDTECVNGTRGMAADHLTKDVVPYLIGHFGVSAAPANWGVAGFSAGGTCAVDLAVMHPELFGAFIDIAGDLRPNSGTDAETIRRLFGGDRSAWQNFDPSTVISRHGHYPGLSGLFVVSGAGTDNRRQVQPVHNAEYDAATTLCSLGSAHGIDCRIVAVAGRHDWPCAGRAFAATLPWLAAQIGTAGSRTPTVVGDVGFTSPPLPVARAPQ